MISRRRFTTGVVIALTPLGATASAQEYKAQQSGKVPRIAFLTTTSPGGSPTTDAFLHGLRELGYIEGHNMTIEWRWERGSTERFPDFAAEMVRLNVDVIVAGNDVAGRAAQRATKTIPIVIVLIGDPVGGGFAATLSRPGGNVTGLTTQGTDVVAKRLQFFKEALPHLPRMALLVDVADLSHGPSVREIEPAGRILGVQLRPRVDVSSPATLAGAFATLTKEGSTAVFTVGARRLRESPPAGRAGSEQSPADSVLLAGIRVDGLLDDLLEQPGRHLSPRRRVVARGQGGRRVRVGDGERAFGVPSLPPENTSVTGARGDHKLSEAEVIPHRGPASSR